MGESYYIMYILIKLSRQERKRRKERSRRSPSNKCNLVGLHDESKALFFIQRFFKNKKGGIYQLRTNIVGSLEIIRNYKE